MSESEDIEPTPVNSAAATTEAAAPVTPAPTAAYAPPITKFCAGCGNGVVATAMVCPSCGTAVGLAPQLKAKSTAVLLAVFLGAWTWVYTYKRDATKWWVAFGVSLVSVGLALPVFWIWAIVDAAGRSDDFYTNFPNG